MVILVSVLVGVLARPAGAGEVVDRIVCVVNDDIILLSELEEAYAPLAAELESKYTGEDLEQERKRLRFRVLDSLIDERLLVQKGIELGLVVDNDEVEEAIMQIRRENGLEDDEAFRAALAAEGLDLETLHNRVRDQMIASRVRLREIRGKVSITDGDVLAYYEEHPEEFSRPERLRLQLLLLELPEDASALKRAQVEARRDEVLAALARGEDFGELVARYSDGPAVENGGDIGFLTREEMAPEFADIAFSLDVGEVSAPFRTAYGINFIRVIEREEAGRTPFKEVKEQIRRKLEQEQLRLEAMRFADRLREEAYIRKML
jgi:peptidyl-prolyl cis-trans isomerase SurA